MARWNESIMAVNVLQLTAEDAARQERSAHRALSLVSVGSFVAMLALLGVACYHLWLAWHSGNRQDWNDFWDGNKYLWMTASVWLGWPKLSGTITGVYARACALRSAFAERAARSGELAPEQPAPLVGPDLPIGAVQFGPFSSPAYRAPKGMVAAAAYFGILGAGLAVGAVILYNLRLDDVGLDRFNQILSIALGVLAVVCLIAFGYMLWLVRHRRSGVWLAADDWGARRIKTARRRERSEVPWHEARTFFRLDAPPDERHALRAVYGLYGSDRLLAWAVPTRARADQLAANERLCRLIVTRTSLPLRALSTESGLLANDDSAAKAEPTALQPAPTTPSAPSQRQGWNPGCVLVLLCLLVPLVGLIAQFTQGR